MRAYPLLFIREGKGAHVFRTVFSYSNREGGIFLLPGNL